jgi:ubiquitin-conjugating enzyme (huntingtin interacting protein 2)
MSFRLARELKELRDLPADSEVGATPLNDQGTHWEGWIKGPENTPYEGGKFFVDIVVPEGYPFTPLVCKFITKIWHPNVSSVTGVICLDILKTEVRAYNNSPAFFSLLSLYTVP